MLFELERERVLVLTPSRNVAGRRVVCYDDRFVLNLASENEGVVVSNDNYRDLVAEKAAYKRVVEERQLMYTFANDRFMPPEDPLGRCGPSLDSFLRMPQAVTASHSSVGRTCSVPLTKSLSLSSSSTSSGIVSCSSSSPPLSSLSSSSFSPVCCSSSSSMSSLWRGMSSDSVTAAGRVAAGCCSIITDHHHHPTQQPPPNCPYGKKCTYGNKCKYSHPERGNLPHKLVSDRLLEQNRCRKMQQLQTMRHMQSSEEESCGQCVGGGGHGMLVGSQQQHSSLRQCSSLPLSLTTCAAVANQPPAAVSQHQPSLPLSASQQQQQQSTSPHVHSSLQPPPPLQSKQKTPLSRTKSVVPFQQQLQPLSLPAAVPLQYHQQTHASSSGHPLSGITAAASFGHNSRSYSDDTSGSGGGCSNLYSGFQHLSLGQSLSGGGGPVEQQARQQPTTSGRQQRYHPTSTTID